jgi:PadR family transcriptional regulator, regulatory protein PadR
MSWRSFSTYVGYMCRLAAVKLTGPLERVLRVMVADPTAPHYGYDLMKAAKLPSGTLYPMLARLQQEGLVDAEWEAQREDAGGRPPRKYYRLTAAGLRVARIELAQAPSSSSATARRAGRGATRPVPGSMQ